MADPARRAAGKKAWVNKRENWFEAEKMAVGKLRNQGYEIIVHRSGYPDIMATKDGKLVFFEVKRENDTLKDNQKIALLTLKKFGHQVHLWRYREAENDFEESAIA